MAKEKNFKTMDGNTAAAYTSYAFTEVAGIYPITPSSPMADSVDMWSQQGRMNAFDQTVHVVEMQSEAGAAGVVHGSLATGALTTTYTASQGLLLMIPNMYKIAGELLPTVFHVSARAIASHALSIFGDHSDVMACRQTGFAMIASNSVQEATDLAAVSHLATIKSRVPFLHFFDGFRTSHEVQKIDVQSYEDLAFLIDQDALQEFRDRGLSPNKPILKGTAQNPDIFFQAREASNPYYLAVPEIVKEYMGKINELTGRDYDLVNYYGAPDAEEIIIAMGSVCETIQEVVDYQNARGAKVGMISVRLYRPFPTRALIDAVPSTVKRIAVLDRTKEPGAEGEPLYLDVVAALKSMVRQPKIVGGRYGLGSKDTTPDQIHTVLKHAQADKLKHGFTIGIVDDVTHLSLPIEETIDVTNESTISCRFWGLGSDGTVGANKNSIKIIGDHTDQYAQAYFSYDSKKSGGITISDLRFGQNPIHSPYLISTANFVSCSQQSYVDKYDMIEALKHGGTFLLNTLWSDEEIEQHLPNTMKRDLARKEAKLYAIDAVTIAANLGLGNRTNTVLQAAFFKLSNVIPIEDAVSYMKKAIVSSYGNKGEEIVNMNYKAVDAGLDNIREVAIPAGWADLEDEEQAHRDVPAFIENIVEIMNRQKGDTLPVSTFVDRADGAFPQGTAQYEKRGIANEIPVWIPDNCIQCNQCSLVCPHAVIRPFLMDDAEAEATEAETVDGMRPYNNYKYRIQVSALDCTGCATCVMTCPAKEKAIVMKPIEDHMVEAENWDYMIKLPRKSNPMKKSIIKGSQFELPLFEFSGACAGCGETAYAKLVTQLFGDRMQISNATGCSSIWGGSAPSTPYTTNKEGRGPAWANSLFEDNAEHGLGMHLGYEQIRRRAEQNLEQLKDVADEGTKEAIDEWFRLKDDSDSTIEATGALVDVLANLESDNPEVQKLSKLVLKNQDYLSKRSTWIFGGDGWAYDIGFGGLDHVLSTGNNVNVLVFDTEVYSNTGGQSSKATPTGAIAQFAAGGKSVRKKDLGMMAMSYGYVYVAQIAMGANQAQTLKTLIEAESYDGPSLVIAYAPCISHGIKGGMKQSQVREKEAVECGYWHMYRFDPRLEEAGKNPFQLDSKAPDLSKFKDFLNAEVRYSSLAKKFPTEQVELIYNKAENDALRRYKSYERLKNASYD